MRILIYGAGAVGCYIGGHLALAGHDVTLLGRNPLVETVTANGLILRRADKMHRIHTVRANSSPEKVLTGHRYDWIAFTMKAYDTIPALMELQTYMPDPPPVVSFQNGIGSEQDIAVALGNEKMVAATCTSPLSMPEPGVVIEEKARGLAIATDSPAAGMVLTALKETGLAVKPVSNARALKWSKLLLNMLANATSAILDMSPTEVFADPRLFAIEWKALHEALAILDLQGIEVVNLPGAPARLLTILARYVPAELARLLLSKRVGKGRGEKLPSLLAALRADHRRTEVAWLNGAVAQAAHNLRRLTPVNHALALLVADIASGRTPWEMYRHRPDMLLTAIRAAEGMLGE